jgi:plastocyanin
MRRSTVPVLSCLLLLGGVIQAAPASGLGTPAVTVSMTEYAYSPSRPTLSVGQAISFSNDGTVTHGAKVGPPKLMTLTAPPATTSDASVSVAGTYPFHCQYHPDLMKGALRVAPTLDVTSGAPGTVFTLTWSTGMLDSGAKMKVQMRRDGGNWNKAGGGNGTGIELTPSKSGTYEARVMLVLANGDASKWSPKVSFQVT